MDTKDENTQKDHCCGGHRCCSGRAALALVLLLIGGLIGYGAGRCHSSRMGCSMGSHMEAPATPGK